MATKSETQVEWSTADTISLTTGSPTATSDAVSINADDVEAVIEVKGDNSGTPASGDYVEVRILYTAGDPDVDPDSADEYTTVNNAPIVGRLDTNLEDPAIILIEDIPTSAKALKVYLESNAASNTIVCSAQYRSTRTA